MRIVQQRAKKRHSRLFGQKSGFFTGDGAGARFVLQCTLAVATHGGTA
jgi:hypothetical protein